MKNRIKLALAQISTRRENKEENLGKMLLWVAASDADHAILCAEGHTIAQRPGQPPRLMPNAIGFFQDEHSIVPDLCATLPGQFIWKIRAARHKQRAIMHSGVSTGETQFARERRKVSPLNGRRSG